MLPIWGLMNDFDEAENGKQISQKTLNSILVNIYFKTTTVLLLVIEMITRD